MECLVSGATGFLGRHVVRKLLADGHRVRALVRSESLSLEREGADLVLGDMLEPDTLAPACEGADAVFHLAGRVQHKGQPTEVYPMNPNGSADGIAGATSADGRVTMLMPHPERVHRTVQHSWAPEEWGEDGPWLRMFRNARVWVD